MAHAETIAERRSTSPWLHFAVRRLIGLIAIFVVLLVVSFLIVQLIPGDPAAALAGANADLADIERVRQQLGLDQPLWQRFTDYAGGVLSGDLGTSFMYRQPVLTIIETPRARSDTCRERSAKRSEERRGGDRLGSGPRSDRHNVGPMDRLRAGHGSLTGTPSGPRVRAAASVRCHASRLRLHLVRRPRPPALPRRPDARTR
jgi:hypothetical protein